MKRHFCWLVINGLISYFSTAQTLRRPIAAPYTGLGAYSIFQQDVFSFTANPASLAELKKMAAGFYGERRFLLRELNYYQAAMGLPTVSGNFGLKTTYYGFNNYNETQLGLAYGRKLGTKVNIGAVFNYQAIRIAGYGHSSAMSFELGTLLHITDKLHAGLNIANPVGGKFGKDRQERLASLYTVGVGYDASSKFFISAAIEKEEEQPVNVNAGFQYKFLPRVLARAGLSTATSSLWVGIGLTVRSFRLDITTSYHPQLGITPGLLLIFNFKEKSD